MRKSFLLIATLILAMGVTSTANAQHAGQMGLGVLTVDYPVAVSYGINDQTVGTLAFGFSAFDKKGPGGMDPGGFRFVSGRFGIAGGVNYDLVQGNNWGFGIAPALAFDILSFEDDLSFSYDSDTNFSALIALGGHWDPTDNQSFWFRHGLAIDVYSPGDATPVGGGPAQSADSWTDYNLGGDIMALFGWTAWFGG